MKLKILESEFDNIYVYDGGVIPDNVTKVQIADDITRIPKEAFCRCINLTTVIIPNSVTRIGNSAFAGCSNLTDITIPDSVTYIGVDAFNRCKNLKSITIPEGVTSLKKRVFDNCTSLETVIIPNSVNDIGYCAFYDCESLKSITIPDGVTSIGEYAFGSCSNLESITIPDTVVRIKSSFDHSPNLTVYTDNKYVINYCRSHKIPIVSDSVKIRTKTAATPKIGPIDGVYTTSKGYMYADIDEFYDLFYDFGYDLDTEEGAEQLKSALKNANWLRGDKIYIPKETQFSEDGSDFYYDYIKIENGPFKGGRLGLLNDEPQLSLDYFIRRYTK
jgi:hypothetical protein